MTTVVFTGGGTGGHIYPGLAIADELKKIAGKETIKIVWIGSKKPLDKNIVSQSDSVDIFKGIPSGKLRRYFSLQNFLDVFKIFFGFVSAFFLLLRYKPVFIFSKGGFVSVPPCIAAKLLKIPVYTHECDFSPGLATRINARFAKNILVSFPETKERFSVDMQKKVIITGNPVRPVFHTASKQKGLQFLGLEKLEKPLLLVVGGSLGARQINTLVLENIDWLCKHFVVLHQTGKNQIEEQLIHKDYYPMEFIYNEMPDVMDLADVVLSRAGSNFLWECVTLEKPMVLIPLSGSGTRGDQVENAHWFEEKNAAKVLMGTDITKEDFKKALELLLKEENRQNLRDALKEIHESNENSELKIAQFLFREIEHK